MRVNLATCSEDLTAGTEAKTFSNLFGFISVKFQMTDIHCCLSTHRCKYTFSS